MNPFMLHEVDPSVFILLLCRVGLRLCLRDDLCPDQMIPQVFVLSKGSNNSNILLYFMFVSNYFQIIFNIFDQFDRGRREGSHKGKESGCRERPALEKRFEAASKKGPGVPSAGQSGEQHLGGLFKIICLCADAVKS